MNLPADIRRQIRSLRQNLPPELAREKSLHIAEHFISSPIIGRSRRVATYLSNDGEVGTQAIVETLWSCGKACYLPILRSSPQRSLWFGRYAPETALIPNRFHIPEPAIGEDTVSEPWTLDLVLVPLVAFDLSGNRIGMGGGYYDRTFAYLKDGSQPRSPILIGLAFECQKWDRIPAEPWDVPLNGVVTEEAFYTFT
ncbi:5-formyltetrahydrofolate cyclo-ligase [Methylocaldum sp.]|uniref:5-formyltetrahydrofolate cyclo-ligase n=1 Tax=Methylocaldum sp. TaxID=1969727 RepID=UPI002D7534AF|nr:5-formyltetrahydrofolate cyclo-ligase [Methylocaldum sp.]HYE34872.1 5-formyltetrahydrofolate cyclo-ligase [Methylocaldum sp.]